jgi:putative ATP-dependent endonuclease of the OLD family
MSLRRKDKLTSGDDMVELKHAIEENLASPTQASPPRLFLRSLEVKNFRAIQEASFIFQPGLNVVIGENNSSKTAVIDALRLLLNIGTFEKKEDLIRLRSSDVYASGDDDGEVKAPIDVSFSATFLADEQTFPQFYDMLCPDDAEEVLVDAARIRYTSLRLQYVAAFEYSVKKARYESRRTEVRGGPDFLNPVSYEALDALRAVYLAPLRDLVNDRLRVGSEIEKLVMSHTQEGKESERDQIPETLRTEAVRLISEVTDNNHQKAAGKSLASYARPYSIPEGSLSFVPWGFTDGLFSAMLPMFEHSLHGAGKLPLSSNGLGMNQLIYASIVLSRRGENSLEDDRHTFFLIEEPEAHLHPQLQDSFFHALNTVREHQIFVTSHSPTLTAKTDLERIIVLRRAEEGGRNLPLHLHALFADREADRRYLHKFLDTTRSQLLFARASIFVEGVTEGLLMQQFSELIGRSLRDHAVEIVVIDGAHGFDHFRPLFDEAEGTYARAVFVTDGDEDPKTSATDAQILADAPALDRNLEIDGSCAVARGYGTFEFELLRASVISHNTGMQDILARAMSAAAPPAIEQSKDTFVRDFLDFEHPGLAYKKMKEKRANSVLANDDWYGSWHTNSYFRAAKSNFAMFLLEELERLDVDTARSQFTVPTYIRSAIEYVTARDDRVEA